VRKQLGLYVERKVKPRRATNAIRFTLARLSRLFDWQNALTIVKPHTLIRWHRKGSPLLEMEITATWSTSHSCPTAEADLLVKLNISRKRADSLETIFKVVR